MSFPETVQPDWVTTPNQTLSGGLNKFLSSDQIDNTELTEAQNVRLEGNKLIGDKGYFPYNWIETTTTAAYSAGQTTITVADNIRYKVPTKAIVRIVLSDGTFHTSYISAYTSNTVFTLAVGLTLSSLSGAAVYIDFRIIGKPIETHRLILKSGSSDSFLLCTDSTKAGIVYQDTGTSWTPVPYTPASGGDTTLSVADVINETIITLTSPTGFAVGDFIRVQLGAATSEYHAAEITVVAGSNITITPPLPEATAIGNGVQRVMEFTGTIDDRIVAETLPWAESFVVTNGVDVVGIYENSTQKFRDLVTTDIDPGPVLARVVRVFDNKLVLFNLTYGGVHYPQRAKWTSSGAGEDFAGGSDVDLYEDPGDIVAALQLGPNMYIYKKFKGIYRMTVSQRLDRDFAFNQMITNHGTISVQGVVAIDNNSHMVWDIDNIFKYTGDFGIQRIGDPIRDILYGLSGTMDLGYIARATALKIRETNEILLIFQSSADSATQSDGADAGPMTALRYNITTGKWTTRDFSIPVFAIGKSDTTSSQAWTAIPGTWGAQSGSWNSSFVAGGTDIPYLIGGRQDTTTSPEDNGVTYRYAQLDSDDSGTPISYIITTKDFVEEGEVRIDWMDIRVAGGSVLVEYSSDEGLNWKTYGTISASTKLSKYRIYKQAIVRSYRFRFTSSDSGFRLDGFRLRVAPETERE